MTTKPTRRLTLKDRLSRLTFDQAARLLGAEGKRLIQQGAAWEIDIEEDVYLRGDLFRVKLRSGRPDTDVVVSITLMASARNRLHLNCTACDTACEHKGAALSLILEDKLALGLSAPPDETVPLENLTESELIERALDERQQRANKEKFRLKSNSPKRPWTDYIITSAESGKSYRVALRSEERGESYCSCPDFRTNTLGTCKHIMYALDRARQKFSVAQRRRPYRRKSPCVHVDYGPTLALRMRMPDKPDPEVSKAAGPLANGPIEDVHKLMQCISRLDKLGHSIRIHPDAEELIEQQLFQKQIAERMAKIRENPTLHPLRKELLKAELLPYQLDGIAFAVAAGRAVLADDMGLGKTIQAVGVAELLSREAQIRRVLVICPASLKSQWRNEIHRFSDRDVQLITGRTAERAGQYDNDCFFTVCNYEQVLRDILAIEPVGWDLIILDEGQRIKNWESKTARVVKGLKSPFALVLSGTPLENRIDELYSVVQFIDDRRLAPAFRFFNRHRVVDEKGKVLGYRNLNDLRETLQPVLLRRTRQTVLDQLPPRTTELVRIPPTDEQFELHSTHMKIVSMIARKAYLTEMDLLRLQKALLMCRMSANSTFLVDKQPPGYSSKLEQLGQMIEQIFAEQDRKAVLFSEWTTMLDLIEPLLERSKLSYVRLDGSVPQKKRQQLVHTFQNDENCRLFITTNAGSTGLNLQAANTVINVDLPWNPAVLEQRIARAHRMGQKQPVQVYALVTEETIEESLLATLSAKHELSLAVLDPDSDVTEVDCTSGMEELRRRLEVLLGAKPEAPVDESQRRDVEREAQESTARRERVAAAGGEMLGAAFRLLGELVSDAGAPPPSEALVGDLRDRLTQCVEEDPTGKPRLTITLPDKNALGDLAQTLARLLASGATEK